MARQHAHGVDFWRVHFSTGGDGWYAEGPYAYERTAKRQLTDQLRYADELETLRPGDAQAAILRTGKIQKLVAVPVKCNETYEECIPSSSFCFNGHGYGLKWVDVA